MLFRPENMEQIDISVMDRKEQTGYTYLEILGVTALVVIVVLMSMGMMQHYKKYAIEETAVQRLKEVAHSEHIYRSTNDLSVNPDGTYGTFFDLQNAGLIPELYVSDDVMLHTVNAFIPHYKLEFIRNQEQDDQEPDAFQFMVQAIPIYDSLGLKTFFVQEDGEVYFHPWNNALQKNAR